MIGETVREMGNKLAGQKLLTQNPTEMELRCIVKNVEPLRAEAQKLLKGHR